jgi:hypothetical protein
MAGAVPWGLDMPPISGSFSTRTLCIRPAQLRQLGNGTIQRAPKMVRELMVLRDMCESETGQPRAFHGPADDPNRLEDQTGTVEDRDLPEPVARLAPGMCCSPVYPGASRDRTAVADRPDFCALA